jgi:hypothetical protein
MTDRGDACHGFCRDDAAVAVRDDDRGLVSPFEHSPDGGHVVGEPGTVGVHGCTRLAAARQSRCGAVHAALLQQGCCAVPPPAPVTNARSMHEHDPHRDLLVARTPPDRR